MLCKENYPHWAILMMLINNQYQFSQVVSVLSHPLQVLFYTIYYILVNIEIRLCNLNYSLYQFRGTTAGPIIAKGIEAADKDPDVDVIIVGRGGGSMEDLWCFNDRVVIEAIYNASTPIISAVGHETDYTLADYAADMRGATPSHAAEIAVLPLTTLQQHLQQKLDYLQYVMDQTLQQKRIELSTIF